MLNIRPRRMRQNRVRRSSFIALLVVLLLLLPMTLAGPTQARAASVIPPPYPSLAAAVKAGFVQQLTVDRAAKRGAAPVILQLRLATPFQPEGSLSGSKIVDSQRLAIQKLQDLVLQKLAGNKSLKTDNVKRFQTIPHLALAVDIATLTTLVKMTDLIVSIEPDLLNPATLAKSVPWIGADRLRNADGGSAGAGQTVAIVDTGVLASHPFLSPRVVSEACYSSGSPTFAIDHDEHGVCPGNNDGSTATGSAAPCGLANCEHGTHVAGIAAGRGGPGIADFNGVAPEATILAVQVFHSIDDNGDCQSVGLTAPCILASDSDVLRGLERVNSLHSAFSIAAVNLSLGGGSFTSRAACDSSNSDYKDAIDNLRSVGIATVAASGNSAIPQQVFMPGVAQPACISSAVSVGATTGALGGDQIPAFSQAASFLDLLAPGVSINSSVTGTPPFAMLTGTSMAAPHVTGAFAALKALAPTASVTSILKALTSTGLPIADMRGAQSVVTPRIQVNAAAEQLTGLPLAPTNFHVSSLNLTGTTVGLVWDDNSASATSYVVLKRAPGQLWTTAVTLPASAWHVVVSGLSPAITYEFQAQACIATTCTASNIVDATTVDTRPTMPTNLHTGLITSSSIEVRWDSVSANPITYFSIDGWWIDSSNPAFSTHSYTFSGLGPSTYLTFEIAACNADGCSPTSGAIGATTLPLVPLPLIPTNLHVCGLPATFPPVEICTTVGGTPLIWTANSRDATRFELQWAQAQIGVPLSGLSWNTVSVAPSSTMVRLSLASGVLSYAQVRACNAGGCSGWSNLLTFTP